MAVCAWLCGDTQHNLLISVQFIPDNRKDANEIVKLLQPIKAKMMRL